MLPNLLPGRSLVPVLRGEEIDRPWPIFWQFGGSSAMRDHDWKIVRSGRKSSWELYDLSQDSTEMNDLASTHPERTAEMATQWETWWKDKGKVE